MWSPCVSATLRFAWTDVPWPPAQDRPIFFFSYMHIIRSVLPLMSASTSWTPPFKAAVLWDVDGTLVESTKLAFDATNEVLVGDGREPVSIAEYKIGCRYTTYVP